MPAFISASAWRMSHRDLPEEGQGCFLAIAAEVLFLVSTFFTWWEIRYRLWSESAVGTIDELELIERRKNSGWRVVYHFRDKQQQEMTRREFIPLSWKPPAGKEVTVHYLPGSDPFEARLAGTENRIAPIIFGVSLLVMLGTLLKYYLEARRAVTMRAPRSLSPR